jgi:BMFP domain-containing protein YqiC
VFTLLDGFCPGQDKNTAVIRSSQEKTEAAVNSVQAELEETIKHWMEDILTSVDQQTQGLHKELDATIGETQLEL